MIHIERFTNKLTYVTENKIALHLAAAKLLQSKLTEDEQMSTESEVGAQDRRAQVKEAAIRGVIFCFFTLIGATTYRIICVAYGWDCYWSYGRAIYRKVDI